MLTYNILQPGVNNVNVILKVDVELAMNRFLKATTLAGFIALTGTTSGCATFFKRSTDNAGLSKAGSEESAGDVVVQQPQLKNPVISPYSRDYWLSVRDGAKPGVRQMYAILATGDWQGSLSHARAWLKKNPGDIDALTVMAASQALGKRYDLAGYYAKLIEKTNPGNADALNILGLTEMVGSGNRYADYKRAMEFFQRAHEASGTQIAAGLNLAHLQLELGNAQTARQTFQAVASRCGDCAPATLGYGVAASRSKDYAAAEDAFNRILRKNPNHSAAAFHLALLNKNGYNKKQKAEDILQKLIANTDIKDRQVKERAGAVLRQLKAEQDRTTAVASDGKAKNTEASKTEDESTANEMLILSSGEVETE